MNRTSQSFTRDQFLDIKQEKKMRKASISSMASVGTNDSISQTDMKKYLNTALQTQSKKMGCNAPKAPKTNHSYGIKFNPLTGKDYVMGGHQETLDDVHLFYSARKDNKKTPGFEQPQLIKENFIHPKDQLINKIRTQSATGRPRDTMMLVAPPKVIVHPTLGYDYDKKAMAEAEARIKAQWASKK